VKRLNIFIDETGDFGFNSKASELYGVSLTFHDSDKSIESDIIYLEQKLSKIGYTGMLHMADLIAKRGDYSHFSLDFRKTIFKTIYYFSRRVPVEIKTVIVNKKYQTDKSQLTRELYGKLQETITIIEERIKKYDQVVVYYDNGQENLSTIIDTLFYKFSNVVRNTTFNKKEKRLFQVADMLTFIDKMDYKRKNNIKFTKSENYFFKGKELRDIITALKDKRVDK